MPTINETFAILRERYPDIELPTSPHASLNCVLLEMSTHTLWFRKPCKNGTATVIMTVQDGKVCFRRPDQNPYIDTGDLSEVRREVYELADLGFVIDYQNLDLLLRSKTVYKPTEQK